MFETDTAAHFNGTEAEQWNKDLLKLLNGAVEKDPTIDLLSIIPKSYRKQHEIAQKENTQSYGAKLNLRTLYGLRDSFEADPEVDLLTAYPLDYDEVANRYKAGVAKRERELLNRPKSRKYEDYRLRFNCIETATVVFPLSWEVASLLARYGPENTDMSEHIKKSVHLQMLLATSLKKLLWDSTKLWELVVRGIVVKCSENVAAKVVADSGDYTEYTTMQYLQEHMPD
ncbi:hypothetical protein KEM55_005735, partial [Ascosphaera atra]